MQTAPSSPPKPPNYGDKPVSEVWRPELTRLPALTPARRLVRWLLKGLVRFLVFCFTRAEVSGLENFPKYGPALVVMNHLGDADALIMLAYLPVFPEALAKIELYNLPVLGALFHAYGVIWVHRGQPDRRAVRAALEGLRAGKFVGVAPEARESLSGGLEEGTEGAAFLAIKAGAPLVPVTITGTQNARLYGNIKRLRRTPVTLRVGKPFVLPKPAQSRSPACPPARTHLHLQQVQVSGRCGGQARERSEGSAEGPAGRHEALRQATRKIMEALARQLPPEYRGVYNYVEESIR